MPRNVGWSLLIFVIALFSPCASATQELDSFSGRLADFTRKLQTENVTLELLKVAQIETVLEPEKQSLEILKSARLLVERDEGFKALTLAQLGVSDRELQWMAGMLVENGIIRQDDYLIQVDWSLPNQRFQTLAVVHPKGQSNARFWLWLKSQLRRLFRLRPLLEPPPDFEPLLYFTPVHIEEDPNNTALPVASGRSKTPLGLPARSVLFASTLAPTPASAQQVKASWPVESSRKLTLFSSNGACITVIWTARFSTDGCRILDPGKHVFPSTPSSSCLFWDLETKGVEAVHPGVKPCPRSGSDARAEECLKFALEYTQGLRLLGRFLPLADSKSTVPQYICCSEPPPPTLTPCSPSPNH